MEQQLEPAVHQEQLVDLVDKPAWKTLLFELVKKEKMDPWDINISTLADSYLKKVSEMKDFTFTVPANAVLAASVLLVLKAKDVQVSALMPTQFENDFFADFDDPFDTSMDGDLGLDMTGKVNLEPELNEPTRNPSRPISLDELVAAVQTVMDRQKVQREKRVLREREEQKVVKFPKLKLSAQNMQTMMKDMLDKLHEKKDSQDLVIFSSLVKDSSSPKQLLNGLIPILHLSNDRKCDVWQDAAFGEVFIRVLPKETA
ncbi:MAG: hypothetical protein GOV15_01860 [Candidatus Diapherotrites archaeon]|nr:hypothetical protein [Candidatus Diapherotrites archaeon]